MVFLVWEKTGNDTSKATEISNSLFIRRFRSRFFLQIYSLSANKANYFITGFAKTTSTSIGFRMVQRGICSLRLHIPCPCREGPYKQKWAIIWVH